MEDTRTFLIIANGHVKLHVVATTKWEALDKAYNKYRQYRTFQHTNIVRERKAINPQNIMNKW